jgi:hypothetical protein
VEAVAADGVLFVVFHRNAVQIRLGRHGLVERGVEYGHLLGVRHDPLAGADVLELPGDLAPALLRGCPEPQGKHQLVLDRGLRGTGIWTLGFGGSGTELYDEMRNTFGSH